VDKKLLSRLFIFLLIGYLLFSVGQTMYQSWKVNQEVQDLKNTISELRKANQEYAEKLTYYQSPSYRERIARERFGLQKPGENVVVVVPEEKPKEEQSDTKIKKTSYQKWWDYFFGVDK